MAIFGQKFLFQPNCLAGIGTINHFWHFLEIAEEPFYTTNKLKSGCLFQPNAVNDAFGWMGDFGGQKWPLLVKN